MIKVIKGVSKTSIRGAIAELNTKLAALDSGYEPIGSVTITQSGSHTYVYAAQTVYKKEGSKI